MPEEHQQQVRDSLPSSAEIKFIRVEFDFPNIIASNSSFLDKECGKDWTESKRCGCTCAGGCYWRLNYLHMNRFRTLLIWRLFLTDPYLQQFDYYMNVDADLFLLKDMLADPLTEMSAKQCVFFTGQPQADAVGCYEGQKEATIDFSSTAVGSEFSLFPANVSPIKPGFTFWGGWNCADIRFFKTAAHLQYAEHINEIGKIYTMRWNDQGHYPLAVALLHERGLEAVCHDTSIFDNDKLRLHMHGGSANKQVLAACARDW
jgi:hypothetical protein